MAAPDTSALHSAPIQSTGMLNAVKRARQLTDLTWTVTSPGMPGVHKFDGEREKFYYYPGQIYKGIPYSSVYMTNNYVGTTISVESFVSALQNPHSVLYTEDLSGNSWNEGKAVTYYGMVCSKFAAYVLDIKENYNTQHFFNIDGMHLVAEKGHYTEKDLVRCDVLLAPRNHTAIVTDILSDDDGNTVYIEVSEETTAPHMRRKLWKPKDFFEHFGAYDLYRYAYLDSVPYTPCPFVRVFDETHPLDDRHYDVLSRRGDKTNFEKDIKPMTLDVLTEGWTAAEVTKDGKPFAALDITGKASFELPRTECGFYTVTLSDASGRRSRPAYHCVTDKALSVEVLCEGKLRLSYSCSSGKAIFAQIGHIADSVFVKPDGSGESVVEYDPGSVSVKQVRVSFLNEYGQYVTEFLPF